MKQQRSGVIDQARGNRTDILFYQCSALSFGILSDWTLPFSGDHLYYPSRRQPTAAFTVLLESLRYHSPD
jgi:hypothetical protein